MPHRSVRILTDANETVFITRWENGAVNVAVIDEDGERAMELELSKRDIDEIAEVIHGHDEAQDAAK